MGKRKSKLNQKGIKKLYYAIKNRPLKFFLEGPFAKGFENLEGEEYITWEDDSSFPAVLVDSLENHDRSVTIGPRDFGKTMIFIAYALRQMIVAQKRMKVYYISYKQTQAEDFIAKFAKPISKLSATIRYFFGDDFTRKKTAMDVTNPAGYQCILEPMGLMGSVRSKHADLLLVDDPMKDTSQVGAVATPSEIKRATKVFTESVLPLVKDRDGECHVVGTAMAQDDLLHQLMERESWKANKIPAVKNIEWADDGPRIVGGTSSWPKRWPSAKNFNSQLNLVGLSAFRKEWLGDPGREVDSFFEAKHLDNCFGFDSTNQDVYKDANRGELVLVGGHDPAKKIHPAHAIIFAVDEEGEMWEWEELWMDGWEYKRQVDWWRGKFANLPIYRAYYDNQNPVFEGFEEEGILPSNFQPQVMNIQNKQKIGAYMETRINNHTIHFLGQPGCRTYNQILAVGQDLKATESREGHGEPFTSVGLSCLAARDVSKLRFQYQNAEHHMDSNKRLTKPSRWRGIK